ncbi:GPI-anchored cell surface glycoprotein [Colletotrichum tabaci]|uniref:GPI-anchored cell surface glycoprotein n=1 Tax=Colletotrichum tabaci TaxID=1209068 RepID=A0AAV9SV91_9PEZI
MSLNGLDDPKVKEAHEAAVAEPGGWFLLKYASRDDVELLGRGTGGIVEIRNNIAQFENENDDNAPLFGFLKYRRRNVIIKYLPDDCSRLVQARVTVHFNAVCERFAPYNTDFSIATAKDLKDTKLSAACSLHAASGSTSSSTSSLRRRRLMEIAEEEEEEQRASKRKSVGPDSLVETSGEDPADAPKSPIGGPPVTLNADLANSPEESKFSASLEPPEFVGARPSSPTKSVDEGRRMSSQSLRPELYSSSSYTYGKPRVKLAPRPSLDVSGRARAGTAAVGAAFRPISQMPSGFKLFSKGPKKGKYKENTLDPSEPAHPDETTEISLAATLTPLPDGDPISHIDELVRPHTSSGRPTTSSGASIKSAMPSFTTAPSTKQVMTPEKARLMKAMQLREKKKKMMNQQSATTPAVDAPAEQLMSEKAQPAQHVEEIAEHTLVAEADDGEEEEEDDDDDEDDDRRLSVSKADSGIVVDASSVSVHTDVASEFTQSDSHPASPIMASSEPDHSTKASSLSESTEETVKESNEDNTDAEVDTHETHDAVESATESGIAPDQAAEPASPVEAVAPTSAEPEAVDGEPQEEGESLAEGLAPAAVDDVPVVQSDATPEAVTAPGMSETQDTSTVEKEATLEVAEPVEQQHNETEKVAVMDEQQKPPISLPISKFSTSPTQAKPSIESKETQDQTSKQDIKAETAVSTTSEASPRSPLSPLSPCSPSLRVPRSKFSTQDLRAAANVEVLTIVSPPEDVPREPVAVAVDEPRDADAHSVDTEPSKRKALVEPIRTDLDPPKKAADGNISDDEDLMDELHSATVQQAQHITVSKSPITPVFPSPTQSASRPTSRGAVRTISNPVRGNLLTPADVAQAQNQRSVSSGAAFLHRITQQQGNQHLAPKQPGKIGSSISQRIKALEKLSAHAPGTVDADTSSLKAPRPSSAFFAVKRGASVREPPRSPSVVDRASSLTRGGSPVPSVMTESQESSPEAARANRGRSGSMANRLSMFEVPGSNPPRGQPESISVTARIVRDPSQSGRAPEPPKNPSEFERLDLKVSPLVVDHQKAEPLLPPANLTTVKPSKETIQERRLSKEKRRSQSVDPITDGDEAPRRSSLSIMKDFIKDRRKSLTSPSAEALTAPLPMSPGSSKSPSRPPSTHHNSSGLGRRLSISSRRSSFSKDNDASGAMSPSLFTEGSGSGDDSKSTTSDKKKGRAGRFMRRLSSSLSSGARSKTMTPTAISPTVQEEDASEVARLQQPTIEAFMGDVNVQFPDNLLWKRRSMCMDSQGFLILSTVAASTTTKDKQPTGAGVKRYHLSDFRMPYIPDMEIQELPNSICLDFVEGSGLQVACEDRAGQMNVLHILQDAHQSHNSFGQ